MSTNRISTYLLLFMVLAGCQFKEQTVVLKDAGVFDTSPRRVVDQPQNPHWRVLKILVPTAKDSGMFNHCTGALVGKNIVLTAAHCFVETELWDSQNTRYKTPDLVRVVARYMQTDSSGRSLENYAKVKKIHLPSEVPDKFGNINDHLNDWALLEIDKNLGNKYGWLGTNAVAASESIQSVDLELWSYPLDINSGSSFVISSHCKLRRRMNEHSLYYHDCSTKHGSSGAPLIREIEGRYYVVGINVASSFASNKESRPSYSDADENFSINLALGTKVFLGTLKELLKLR